MDAIGVVIAVLLGLAVVAGLAFFAFVAVFVFKTFFKVARNQEEFDKQWRAHRSAWNRHGR